MPSPNPDRKLGSLWPFWVGFLRVPVVDERFDVFGGKKTKEKKNKMRFHHLDQVIPHPLKVKGENSKLTSVSRRIISQAGKDMCMCGILGRSVRDGGMSEWDTTRPSSFVCQCVWFPHTSFSFSNKCVSRLERDGSQLRRILLLPISRIGGMALGSVTLIFA